MGKKKTWDEAHAEYREWLRGLEDDSEGMVRLGNVSADAADFVAWADPTMYRMGLLDWLNSEGIDSDTLKGEDHADPRTDDFYVPAGA